MENITVYNSSIFNTKVWQYVGTYEDISSPSYIAILQTVCIFRCLHVYLETKVCSFTYNQHLSVQIKSFVPQPFSVLSKYSFLENMRLL